jgi:hypothetical protein
LTIEKKHITNLFSIQSKRKTNHGFGAHGFVTTVNGHGITIHPQVPHGARVATVVVVVVVVVVVITNR